MIEKNEFKIFLYLSQKKYLISVFSEFDHKCLFKNEYQILVPKIEVNEIELYDFLSQNIFNIEKKIGQFVKNINLILDIDKFLTVNLGIKNYINSQDNLDKVRLNLLYELKSDFKKNFKEFSIAHFIINNYLFDDQEHTKFDNQILCHNFCLEAKIICIKQKDILYFENILNRHQVAINKILSGKYVSSFISDKNIDECEFGMKMFNGYNLNEVFIEPKIIKNKGIFEKFFKIFS